MLPLSFRISHFSISHFLWQETISWNTKKTFFRAHESVNATIYGRPTEGRAAAAGWIDENNLALTSQLAPQDRNIQQSKILWLQGSDFSEAALDTSYSD